MSLDDLIPILQVSIGPVILISGVGLLLLTMTNRFGRIIDRSRQFCDELLEGNNTDTHKKSIEAQLNVLLRRANIVRAAIALAGLSALLAALLIIVLFINSILQLGFILLISILFSICMLCLIGSLIFFIIDINISLTVIKIEAAELDNINT